MWIENVVAERREGFAEGVAKVKRDVKENAVLAKE